MLQHKINFDNIEWEYPIKGVKYKKYIHNNKQMRLIKYTKEMPPHWCETGHYGLFLKVKWKLNTQMKK
jgi:hypothetical protein